MNTLPASFYSSSKLNQAKPFKSPFSVSLLELKKVLKKTHFLALYIMGLTGPNFPAHQVFVLWSLRPSSQKSSRRRTLPFLLSLSVNSVVSLANLCWLSSVFLQQRYSSSVSFLAAVRSFREKKKMNRRNGGTAPKLELKLHLSPPRANPGVESPSRSATVSPTSPPSSCVSSELNQDDAVSLRYSNSPEATSMLLVGCPRCLMYVMLSEDDPKCPKCKSTVLLDVLHDNATVNTRKS